MESKKRFDFSIFFIVNLSICLCATTKSSQDTIPLPPPNPIYRPDLGCILFGDAGCSISCNVMCDMYGCQCLTPSCINEMYCECNEIYEISSAITTITDYNKLSFNKLWNYKITKSKISKKIRKKIFQYPETFDEILKTLRDPHKTGLHVKRRLMDLHPKWSNVGKLQPRQLGYIHNLTDDGRSINDDGLKQYLNDNMEPLIEEMYGQLQKARYKLRLGAVLDNIDREDEVKHIIKQILLSKKNSLYDYATNHLKQKGFSVDEVVKSLHNRDNSESVTVYDTDQIILASVIKKLLDVKENNHVYAKKTFSLSEEMTVGQDDLYDSDFNELTDEAKAFALSNEMTVSRDDLYDSDFGTFIQNSKSKRKRKAKRVTKNTSINTRYEIAEPTTQIVINNNNNGRGNNNNNNNNNEYFASYINAPIPRTMIYNNNNNNNNGYFTTYNDESYNSNNSAQSSLYYATVEDDQIETDLDDEMVM